MSRSEMPERLPEEFRDIWEALRQADEESPSRQALARRLGASTHTIQRILVDGEVPRLSETRNTRVRRAWVRILTRLALAVGRKPREWIEMVGIPYDDDARSTSEDAVRKAKARVVRAISALGGGTTGQEDGITGPGDWVSEAMGVMPESAWPDHVRIGLAARGVFSGHLDSLGGSFLEMFVRRLAGAVNPSMQLRIQNLEEREVVSGLLSSRAKLDLGVGITETVHRRYLGLTFVPIPGISMRLGAICLKGRDSARCLPEWRHAILPGQMKDRYFLVTSNDVAHDYLIGQCGIAPREILARSVSNPGRIGKILLEETGNHPDHWIIFVDGDDVCGLVANNLEGTGGFLKRYSVEDLPGAKEECPRYPVGIALRMGAGHWRGLLEAARNEELLGGSARRTAYLYASLMIASFLDRNPAGLPHIPKLRGTVELTHFEKAVPEFQEVLFRNLIVGLKQVLLSRLESEGGAEGADALESRATERATAYAEALIPHEWLQAIEEALIRSETAETYRSSVSIPPRARGEWFPWCQSCSISLADEHNRGVSEHFCRFCSDEEGKLKSRSKVQNLIARWFERWQENLNHDEAMRRAGFFMRAMPAWSHN